MKKMITNPLFITVTGGVLATVLATPIVAMMNSVKWTEAISIIFSWLWNGLIAVLNFEIRLWWLLLGIALLIVVVFVLDFITSSKDEVKQYSIYEYKTDVIGQIKWMWTWKRNYDGNPVLHNDSLHPICKTCLTDLTRDFSFNYGYKCTYCNSFIPVRSNFDEFEVNVAKEIVRRTRSEEFKKTLEQQKASM